MLRSSYSVRTTLVAGMVLAAAMAITRPAGAVLCACQVPDNGNGTTELMPTCPEGYLGHMRISDGLPAGATIEIDAVMAGFVNQPEVPGGTLGGEIQTFSATIEMTVFGTGALSGFHRIIQYPVTGEANSAPRTSGDAIQSFDHDMIQLDGELFGDPDFCTLRLRAGSFYGLPSPGHTTLTRLGPPGDPFQIDSFFDIQYELEFVGCPGSILDGMSGTTARTDRFSICEQVVPVQTLSWGLLKARY